MGVHARALLATKTDAESLIACRCPGRSRLSSVRMYVAWCVASATPEGHVEFAASVWSLTRRSRLSGF